MKRHPAFLAFCLALVLVYRPAVAQYESDVESPESIVLATYASIARAPGENFQWDRFRSLFISQATLIPNLEQTGGEFVIHSPESFIALVDSFSTIGGPNDRGFAEEEVHHKVDRYGDVAQVFSTYQKHFWGEEQILGRGINSFQLVHNGGRWWIVSIVWDEESGAGPIPATYSPD
ncbi:MAG: hypothetical protein WD275_08750 [Rhodothermales bacterium]